MNERDRHFNPYDLGQIAKARRRFNTDRQDAKDEEFLKTISPYDLSAVAKAARIFEKRRNRRYEH